MRGKSNLIIYGLLLTAFSTLPIPISRAQTEDDYVLVREKAMRQVATKAVMPVFPSESQKNKAKGVAVAEFEVGVKGEVTKVRILQAPDELTVKAVADAVKQWAFPPPLVDDKPIRVISKLTFYFVLEADGTGHVNNPRQFR